MYIAIILNISLTAFFVSESLGPSDFSPFSHVQRPPYLRILASVVLNSCLTRYTQCPHAPATVVSGSSLATLCDLQLTSPLFL